MPALQQVKNVQFRVETMVVHDGRKLGRLRPGVEGYYDAVPVAVLGVPTRNNTYYDVDAFINQVTDKNSGLNRRLSSGQLYGEWGHPDIIGMPNDICLARLADIRESQFSHHIRSLSTGETLENGGKLVLASVKPTGPYGQSLKDNFDDPCMNTAFSLRAITRTEDRGGLSYRTMRHLITFDAVGCGGYAEASKAYSAGMESFNQFDITVTPVGTAIFSQVSLEYFNDTELNELFGATTITRHRQVISHVKPVEGRFNKITSRQVKSLFHDHFQE